MSPKNVWFTSDTHFNHANIIKFCNRPYTDVQDMEDQLIDNWNSKVKNNDTIYHLGDFAFTWWKDASSVDDLLAKLNGNKILLIGNHDSFQVKKSKLWSSVHDYLEIKVSKQKAILSHYPFRVWNGMGHGSFMLHGHSHGSLLDIGGKTMDVGTDCHNWHPIRFDEVCEYMQDREIKIEDHHTSVR